MQTWELEKEIRERSVKGKCAIELFVRVIKGRNVSMEVK